MWTLRSTSELTSLFTSHDTLEEHPSQLRFHHILLGQIYILGRPHQPGRGFVWIQAVLNDRLFQAEHMRCRWRS